MSNTKNRLAAAGSAFTLAVTAVGFSVLGGGAADAGVTGQTATAITYPLVRNSVAESQVVNYSLGQSDLQKAFVAQLLAVPANGVDTSAKLKDGVVAEVDLAPAVQTKLNKAGPAYLKHWGTVHRNVIGAADAELATTSTQSPLGDGALNLHTASATDKVAFGNEVDFAGQNVKDLGTVGFSVYTTGENNALGNNMPSIIFEIDPNVAAVASNYSSLVYLPANGTANAWTAFNASTDADKHWGLTGTAFNGTACSINGARCTWTEMLAYLGDGGDDAKVLTATLSKGRDYAFSGAVDALKFGGKTYDFEAAGVSVS
ncbi:hypothetical protein EV651_101567 [Kribbella sp. VKM Ac-2571]|uniref:hypothetical protein n=1 Tax=Kribbella sp. VKM Ac-2571 TaxID=2512222 RepID=UPI001060F248|nr:hypothetical protein [Kribbella sp. VKM Ac-2571]TDO69523.1 hypothetical protein EV651_101567 [Kribbella sp. VKM Ac-2571]